MQTDIAMIEAIVDKTLVWCPCTHTVTLLLLAAVVRCIAPPAEQAFFWCVSMFGEIHKILFWGTHPAHKCFSWDTHLMHT